ncbi:MULTISPECIES: NAD(P)-dependent oxidoreductase [unclassified Nonomuraea]|uniref:NAD-dependent epimerase/dehydratase family protein n=1 Tax=unclassified Nonomuraea TaxID=2593643 RepID=UPI0033CC2722
MGQALRRGLLPEIAQVRLSDVRPIDGLAAHEEFVPADLTDLEQVRAAVRGVDAVVHLGGVADETGFDTIKGPNLEGVHNVFEACRREGVRRVVNTSSNRITGFYPMGTLLDGREPPGPTGSTARPRPSGRRWAACTPTASAST